MSRIIFFALSHYETPELIRKTSKFIVQSKNKQLNSIILQFLSEITEQSCIDEVCKTWAKTNPETIDYICRLAIEQDNQAAYQIAIKAQYAPHEPNQKALFYFLTEQWDKYESLDYEHSLLQKVYELGEEKLRKQIADKARQAGRVEWIQIAASGRKDKRLGEMTDAEWETTLAVLNSNKQWDKMWQLAQKAPAFWSKQLLQQLEQAAWLPTVREEREGFERLKYLADKSLISVAQTEKLMYCQRTLTKINTSAKMIFSPDGKLLAKSNIDNTITLWRMPEGQPLVTLSGHNAILYQISFSPDSKLLAIRSCSNIKVFRTSNVKEFSFLMGHTEGVNDVIFSPDGKLLVSSSKDRTIRLWQCHTSLYFCRPSATLTGHNDSVGKIIFSPDGQILASCSRDSIIKLWSSMICLPVKQLCNHYREWVQKTLQDNKITEEEKNWLYFTQALMDWHQRFDVEVEDAIQLVSTGEFDIEVES